MILVIGEVLFDVFPDCRRLGGAPLNVACHLNNFGRPVLFLSRIGRDPEGLEVLAKMRRFGLDVKGIQIDDLLHTGRALIDLDDDGNPHFQIPAPAAFDGLQIPDEGILYEKVAIRLIYLGSLIQRTANGKNMLRRLLKDKPPATKCLVDLNLRPGCYSRETVLASLDYADILKVNEDELGVVRELTGIKKSGDGLVFELQQRYAITWLAVTRGARGSTLFADGKRFDQAAKPVTICDTVGAGDAFTALLALGYVQRLAPEIIVRKAAQFAAHVCQVEGALPISNSVYTQLMK